MGRSGWTGPTTHLFRPGNVGVSRKGDGPDETRTDRSAGGRRGRSPEPSPECE